MSFGIPNKGGADFIAFAPEVLIEKSASMGYAESPNHGIKSQKNILTVQFYEIKTAKDKMSKDQIDFANLITKMGGDYFIVHELNIINKPVGKFSLNEDGVNFVNNSFMIEKWGVK